MTAKAAELVPGAEHPVVRTHPDTGRRHLYVNRGFTRSIVGLAPDESDALLELLFRHCEQPNIQVRHQWSPGDVAIWDELPTLHFATADHFPQRREMARITVVAYARAAPHVPRRAQPTSTRLRSPSESIASLSLAVRCGRSLRRSSMPKNASSAAETSVIARECRFTQSSGAVNRPKNRPTARNDRPSPSE